MMEGAFYQQKKGSPTTLAVVVLMHGAALTALALAKTEVIREVFTNPKVYNVEPDKPPPVEPPKQVEKSVTPPPQTVITHVPPVIETPPRDMFAEYRPLPPVQPPIFQPVREIVPPKVDPPVPPAAKTVEPARAKANLASYVSDSDYPTTAVRHEEQGTTRFRLAVGPDGRVKECSVTRSSGSSTLDSTTCKLMKQRARFTPARDSNDRPTGDTFASAIRWQLPSD